MEERTRFDVTQFELTKEFQETFQQYLDEKKDDYILGSLDGVNPADISALLDEFNTDEC